MKHVSDNICRENQNPQLIPENRAVYEIIWENVVEPDGPEDIIIWRMRIASWIT